MFINTTITSDCITPTWNGKSWKYCGEYFRSLRLLKTKSDWKLHNFISSTMATEIKEELDKEILESLIL